MSYTVKNILQVIKDNYKIALGLAAIITIITSYLIYRATRRVKSITDLPKNYMSKKLRGFVTHVGDGDGFKFYHIPALCRNKFKKGKETLSVRLAGVDAPEVRKYSIPAQPLSKESKEHLEKLIKNKTVTIKMLNIDRYDRILASVYIGKVNVSVEMVRVGLACVYIGKDAQYDDCKEKLLKYEKKAAERKLGIWGLKNYVSPMEFKRKNNK